MRAFTSFVCARCPKLALAALLLGVLIMATYPAYAQSGYQQCDEQYYLCWTKCAPGNNQCVTVCQNQDLNCTGTASYYSTTYHSYELLSGWSNKELNYCRQMGHRIAFNHCFTGKSMYDKPAYDACRAAGGDVVDCCYNQQDEYFNDNCIF